MVIIGYVFIVVGIFTFFLSFIVSIKKKFTLSTLDKETLDKVNKKSKLGRDIAIPMLILGIIFLIIPYLLKSSSILGVVILVIAIIYSFISELKIFKELIDKYFKNY
ncbi:hypothetical protein CPJCM30710_23940 [Clostridium polyendosporum]|uniref:DUF3784 domain-containing protein n=1 Tax=Clostridium polyendosporum TaxID=69208 RepID=A0A919S1V5_9CLOT|nr:hypothetical protein CPJCM30710_23940 [Clostridium polyendosporum]